MRASTLMCLASTSTNLDLMEGMHLAIQHVLATILEGNITSTFTVPGAGRSPTGSSRQHTQVQVLAQSPAFLAQSRCEEAGDLLETQGLPESAQAPGT